MNATQTKAAVELAFTALSVATGATSPTEGARRVLGILPDLVPVDELKEFLRERDRIFVDLEVDVEEALKLEGKTP